MDVESNCHQPCPSGNNMECESPDHSCWAFVHACKARTATPTAKPVATRSPTKKPTRVAKDDPMRDPDAPVATRSPTKKPTRVPAKDDPTRDPDAPTTPEGQKDRFYCATRWNGIVCGVNNSCPSGDSR